MAGTIGVINVARLLDDSQAGRAHSQALRQAADRWQAELDGLQARQRTARERREALGPGAAPAARHELEREIGALELDIGHLQAKARFELEARREQARAAVLRELDTQLAALASERGLALVLSVPSPAVAWAAPAVDLTDALLARYDASHGRPG